MEQTLSSPNTAVGARQDNTPSLLLSFSIIRLLASFSLHLSAYIPFSLSRPQLSSATLSSLLGIIIDCVAFIMSNFESEKIAPQQKSAFFSFIKVCTSVTINVISANTILVTRDVQRRACISYRAAVPPFLSIDDRVRCLLGRTPKSLCGSST